jgi:DNA-binding CsgD family transcriptional regulator
MQLAKSHPFFTSNVEIESLISPLKKYNINYFNYRRFYNDHTRIFLGTRPDWLETFLSQEFYLKGNTEARPSLYKQQAVLWSTLPNQTVFQACREHGVDHGIYLIKPGPTYCEFFAFASTPHYPGTVNFYLNNLDFLDNFTLYFKDRASALLKESEKHKIILPYHQQAIEHYKQNENIHFYDHLSKNQLNMNHKNLKISQRQRECINLLLTGATTKEMAKELKISHRTVEDYVNFLKQKFQARNKVDLILKLSHFQMSKSIELQSSSQTEELQ